MLPGADNAGAFAEEMEQTLIYADEHLLRDRGPRADSVPELEPTGIVTDSQQ